MLDLDIEEYRKLHRTLGGHPENFAEWLQRHQQWEQARRAEREAPKAPKRGGKRVAQG